MPTALRDCTFRFGAFQLDPRSGQLRKHGIKIKLQDQPVQILVLLLERAGEVVSREDIRVKLWSENTFVDFDNAISSAVRKVREALSDRSDTPRFVETVARQGYRFVCPVSKDSEPVSLTVISTAEEISAEPTASGHAQNADQVPRTSDGLLLTKRAVRLGFLTVLVLLSIGAAWWMGWRQGSPADGNPLSNA